MCSKIRMFPAHCYPYPWSTALVSAWPSLGEARRLVKEVCCLAATASRWQRWLGRRASSKKGVYIMISTGVYAQNSIGYFPIQKLSTCFFGINPPYDSQMTRLCADEARSTRSTTTNPVFSRRMSYDSGAWNPKEYNHQIYQIYNFTITDAGLMVVF